MEHNFLNTDILPRSSLDRILKVPAGSKLRAIHSWRENGSSRGCREARSTTLRKYKLTRTRAFGNKTVSHSKDTHSLNQLAENSPSGTRVGPNSAEAFRAVDCQSLQEDFSKSIDRKTPEYLMGYPPLHPR